MRERHLIFYSALVPIAGLPCSLQAWRGCECGRELQATQLRLVLHYAAYVGAGRRRLGSCRGNEVQLPPYFPLANDAIRLLFHLSPAAGTAEPRCQACRGFHCPAIIPQMNASKGAWGLVKVISGVPWLNLRVDLVCLRHCRRSGVVSAPAQLGYRRAGSSEPYLSNCWRAARR